MKKLFNLKSKIICLRVIALLCFGAWLIGVSGCAMGRSAPQPQPYYQSPEPK